MEVTKPYKSIGFGAIDATNTQKHVVVRGGGDALGGARWKLRLVGPDGGFLTEPLPNGPLACADGSRDLSQAELHFFAMLQHSH